MAVDTDIDDFEYCICKLSTGGEYYLMRVQLLTKLWKNKSPSRLDEMIFYCLPCLAGMLSEIIFTGFLLM